MYKIVQTGAKIDEGGVKKGLFNPWYQIGTDGKVKIDPITPVSNGRNIEIKNLTNLLSMF